MKLVFKNYKNINKIKTVSDSLIELTNDPDELRNFSDIHTQDFWVTKISKSVSNYNASPLKCLRADDEQFWITSYSTKSKSKYGYKKPNFPSLPFSKALSETSYISVKERRKTAEHAKLIAQQAQERTKRKLDLLERPFELEEQKILDEGLDTKNNADLVALDSKIDGLNRSKFESNCEKELENIEQKHLEKALHVNTLKLKEKLAISEGHLPKTFEKSSPKSNKSSIKINSFLTNRRTPVDSFIDNLVEWKENLIPHVTQFFTRQEAIKKELELRNLPLVDLLRFGGNPVHWLEFIDIFYHRIHKKSSFNESLRLDNLMNSEAKKKVKL